MTAHDIKGLPRDAKKRAACLEFLRLLSAARLRGAKHLSEATAVDLMLRGLSRAKLASKDWQGQRAQARKLLDALVRTGILTRKTRRGYVAYERNLGKRSREDSVRLYEMRIGAVVARSGVSVSAAPRLAQFMRRTSRLHGCHRIETHRGPGLFILGKTHLTVSGEFDVTEGKAVIVGERALELYTVTNPSLSWADDWPLFSVTIEEGRRDAKLGAELGRMRIVPADSGFVVAGPMHDSARAAAALAGSRDLVEAYIGERMSDAGWKSFRASTRASKDLGLHARCTLMGMLDPEIRRVALRDPMADYRFYFQIKKGSREARLRKTQASDAFPLFTWFLSETPYAADICAGGSVVEAISKRTGLPEKHVRALRGVHWQKLGFAMRAVLQRETHSDDGSALRSALSTLPPDMLPKTRREWQALAKVAESGIGKLFPPERVGDGWRAVMRNPEAWAELIDGDLRRAINNTVDALATILTRKLPVSQGWGLGRLPAKVMEAKLFERIAGPATSIKRLRAFRDLWHRDVGKRNSEIRALKRRIMGDLPMIRWDPLTEEGFVHARGRLEWITDEDAIVAEGLLLSHCVGSYLGNCVGGASHIASVFGQDGTRSTVEFGVSAAGKVTVRQHMSYRDAPASGDCVAVVDAFVRHVAKKKFPPTTRQFHHVGFTETELAHVVLDDDHIAVFRESYAPLVGADFVRSLEEARNAYEAANSLPVTSALEQVLPRLGDIGELAAALPRPWPLDIGKTCEVVARMLHAHELEIGLWPRSRFGEGLPEYLKAETA